MSKRILFIGIALLCLHPAINAAYALFLGFFMAVLGLVPGQLPLARWGKTLLAWAVVGLGFSIQASAAISLGREYAVLIMAVVLITLVASWWLAQGLGVDKKTGFLIGSGTAICGGSAIAAVSPAIGARTEQIAVALGCVFILNALALFIFPLVGHALNLDPEVFAVWAAVAIHDTSSVVGAAQAYHADAVAPATALKLGRALLIVPLVLLSVWVFGQQAPTAKATLKSIPNFIPWFIIAIIVAQALPQGQPVYNAVASVAQQMLTLSLFLIGASLNLAVVRNAGLRPLLLASLLWLGIAAGTLFYLIA